MEAIRDLIPGHNLLPGFGPNSKPGEFLRSRALWSLMDGRETRHSRHGVTRGPDGWGVIAGSAGRPDAPRTNWGGSPYWDNHPGMVKAQSFLQFPTEYPPQSRIHPPGTQALKTQITIDSIDLIEDFAIFQKNSKPFLISGRVAILNLVFQCLKRGIDKSLHRFPGTLKFSAAVANALLPRQASTPGRVYRTCH